MLLRMLRMLWLDRPGLGAEIASRVRSAINSHGSPDPAVSLIDRTITCPDGTVRLRFTPEVPQGLIQTGSWTIVSGTGAFEGLRGSGEMEVVYDPDDDSQGRETFTGTVTR